MNEHLVDPDYFMRDVATEGPPPSGMHVLALGAGGKLTEVVWTRDCEQFFYAWSKFPKVKTVTRARMAAQFPCQGPP